MPSTQEAVLSEASHHDRVPHRVLYSSYSPTDETTQPDKLLFRKTALLTIWLPTLGLFGVRCLCSVMQGGEKPYK